VFVKARAKIHRVLAGNPQRSIGEEIARAGYAARIEELSYVEIRADAELSEQLRVRSGARLFRHEKLTFADGRASHGHHDSCVGAQTTR